MSTSYYAVAFGHSKGVFHKWSDAQEQIKGFPQAVYKKFETKKGAEEFNKLREPLTVSFVKDDPKTKVFYAVARGKRVGVFNNYEEVKESISEYPQPMHKKFDNFADAKAYYQKYAKGLVEASSEQTSKEKSGTKNGTRVVARKRTHGEAGDGDNTDESDDHASEHKLPVSSKTRAAEASSAKTSKKHKKN